jgi:CHAT domain-containing protein
MKTERRFLNKATGVWPDAALLRMQLILVACCLLGLCLASEGFAQKPDEAAFDGAASKHKRELRDLLVVRGLSLSRGLRDATLKSVTARLREDFPQGTVLLFYDYEEPTLRVWVVSGEGMKEFRSLSVSREELRTAVIDLRSSLDLDSPQRRSGNLRAPRNRKVNRAHTVAVQQTPFNRARLQLTHLLMPDAIASAVVPAKHLIVVPVLEISAVPFALLRPYSQDASDGFLIERMSISIAPSLYDIGQQMIRKGQQLEPGAITATWNPQFRSPLIVGNPLPLKDLLWEFDSLPGAQSEAAEVARKLGVNTNDVLIRDRATKEALAARVEKADFLYLATHGIASSEQPLTESFLALGAGAEGTGRWTAKEIQDAMLGAKLAVLSGCSTGLGQLHAAGTIGLARAFQKSGVPRVVMSLWDVEDLATRDLMLLFVENLKMHIPSEALRQAMLEYKKRNPKAPPSQWAAFTLFGTPR